MSATPRYQVVLVPDGQHFETLDLTAEELRPALAARGFTYQGDNRNTGHRRELQGQPRFSGLHGPLYGGPGCIRYEDATACEWLSA